MFNSEFLVVCCKLGALWNFAKALKTSWNVPKEDQVSRFYMDLHSAV